MTYLARAFLVASLFVAGTVGVDQAMEGITARGIEAHVRFLSHDSLDGRVTGTRGAILAAEYLAAQFLRIGLEPVDGGFLQDIPVRGVITDPGSVALAFEHRDVRIPASYPDHVVIWPGSPLPNIQVSGELVFVGYGVDAPGWAWDDFKNRDLTGKVLLILLGDPPAPPDDPALFDGRSLTYYGDWTYKLEEARRRGAAGALIIHDPDTPGLDWETVRAKWSGEQFMLDPPERGLPLMLRGWLSRDMARSALAAAGLDLDELHVQAARRDFRPIATGVTVRARMNTRSRSVTARNVIGWLPGSDPERRDEVVVLTAHYDATGRMGASAAGLLLAVAEAFARLDPVPDRSLLFVATAAEEVGQLGSRYYVGNPAIPLDRSVAAINMDGSVLRGGSADLIVLGLERSTLGAMARERAGAMDMEIRPGQAPEQGPFFRASHFPFARAGVPALNIGQGLQRPEPLALDSGLEDIPPASGEGDELDVERAVRQARFVFGLSHDIAQGTERPGLLERSAYRGEPQP